ncbi:MAG TPA: PilN domain-containing protein [Gaiellaceae bacterium]|nr:PilN domain-containing protein [Gaiellaceae bacterium]
MRAVNLLPRDEKRQRRQPGAVTLTAVLGGVLVTAVLAGLFLMTSSTVSDRRSNLDALRAELAAIPPAEETPNANAGLENEKSQRVTLLGKALGSRVAWDRILREISLVLPEDVWFESLTANAPDPNFVPTPGKTEAPQGAFTITGYSYSHDGVARLLARLSVLPQLERPTLGSSMVDDSQGRDLVKFTISASLKDGAAA